MAMTIRLLRADLRRRRKGEAPASTRLAGVALLTARTWGRRLVEVGLVSDAGEIRRNAGAAVPLYFATSGKTQSGGHLDRGRRIVDELGGDDRLRRNARFDQLTSGVSASNVFGPGPRSSDTSRAP